VAATAFPELIRELIREMMNGRVGADVPGEWVPLMLDEMERSARDERFVVMGDGPASKRELFPVVVIGAGRSGVLASIRSSGRSFLPPSSHDRRPGRARVECDVIVSARGRCDNDLLVPIEVRGGRTWIRACPSSDRVLPPWCPVDDRDSGARSRTSTISSSSRLDQQRRPGHDWSRIGLRCRLAAHA
jgi:hypothetical protein